MTRKRKSSSGFYDTIEYIGPRPGKPKRRNFFGGWVIVVIFCGVTFWFGKPLMPFLQATQEQVGMEEASLQASLLDLKRDPASRLAAAALVYAASDIQHDPAYYKLTYPGGDLPSGRGMAADVLIRCLRKLGIDLQKQVHLDMQANFRQYPQLWNALGPDTNIDHRRVPNLQRFLERKAKALPVSNNPADYQPGDIVFWSLANAEQHLGIVVPGPGKRATEPWVVHHLDGKARWEPVLFDFSKIEARFRYPAKD